MTCTFDLLTNDIAGTNPIDPSCVNIFNIQAGLTVVNNLDGTVDVSSLTVGTYTFDYNVCDTSGNPSNTVTVTVIVS
jgi:hypothetical protein